MPTVTLSTSINRMVGFSASNRRLKSASTAPKWLKTRACISSRKPARPKSTRPLDQGTEHGGPANLHQNGRRGYRGFRTSHVQGCQRRPKIGAETVAAGIKSKTLRVRTHQSKVDTLHHQQYHRQQPGDKRLEGRSSQSGDQSIHGTPIRGKRNRKRAFRLGDPSRQPAQTLPVCTHQLRRHTHRSHRI